MKVPMKPWLTLISLERTLKSINVYFLAFLNDLETWCYVKGTTLYLWIWGFAKQQMIRDTTINDMETSGCSYNFNSQVKINVAEMKDSLPPKNNISICNSIILL